MANGMIIFLNGTSSAGKTSIAQALLTITPLPLIHLSVDQFILAIPTHYWAANDRETIDRTFANIISGYHHCIAALAATGNYVLADHVLQEPAWWSECAQLFAPFTAHLITVFCPLDELERRETERGDREIGLARFQYDRIYRNNIQDLKVDTSIADPLTCATRINEYIVANIQPTAFSRLREHDGRRDDTQEGHSTTGTRRARRRPVSPR
jgi:chloramphenicol 3-O phosphotransferase